MNIRSGRFFKDNTNAEGEYEIIALSSNKANAAVYRLFNSGDVEFKLDVGTGDRMLGVNQSIDVAIGQKESLKVSWAKPSAPVDVRLSYNYLADVDGISLEALGELRSGRFSGVPTHPDATTTPPTIGNNTLVDLGTAGRSAYYRILNSGDNDAVLHVGGHGPITVPSKFSKDVLVTDNTPGKGLLTITTETEVDIIYDLLGGVE